MGERENSISIGHKVRYVLFAGGVPRNLLQSNPSLLIIVGSRDHGLLARDRLIEAGEGDAAGRCTLGSFLK